MADSNARRDPAPLLSRPLVPVASVEDAVDTCEAALPYVAAAGGRMSVVHVVEKAGGAPDKASVEQREEIAGDVFETARTRAAEAGVDVETRLLFGTNVADAILDAAREADASAIVFAPRGGKWWWDLFDEDVRDALVTKADRPVVVLPTPGRPRSNGDSGGAAGDETSDGGADE